ncbi:MAG TPA: serine hydrolase [Longimicrobiaceae bacterium]|nr:serine hydrolase [Longimicrobiaceae bacterium]
MILTRVLPVLLSLALALAAGGCDTGGPAPATPPEAVAAWDEPLPGPAAAPDSALLAGALAEAARLPRLHSLLVSQHGRIAAERYFRGTGPDTRANIKSASKSVLAALVGIAIREGHLRGVDQPVAEILPEYFGPGTDPRKRRITVEHLLTMTAGLESTSFGGYGRWVSSRDWVRAALDRPLVSEPGDAMVYSTGSTHILSAVLTRATGRSTYAYARERLAEPLGIRLRPWQRDPQGIFFGGNDMYLAPREMLRFGELYLNGGVYREQQIVPREWVEASFRPRTASGWSGHEYGYGWWIRRSGGHPVYFAWGYGGQYIFVVPDLRLVAVFTSVADAPREGGHLPALHALLDRYLVPAAEARDRRSGKGDPARSG